MTAREYLQQIQKADVIINQRIQEKADLRRSLISISAPDISRERVQGGKLQGDKGYSQKVVKLIDLETEIDGLIDDYVDLKHKIIGEIHGLQKAEHIKLLYKRYIENKKFERIADEMNFAYQYAKELHSHALKEFERTYPNLL